jgi:hypothetical protein
MHDSCYFCYWKLSGNPIISVQYYFMLSIAKVLLLGNRDKAVYIGCSEDRLIRH